jgi:hypothetical protein
MDLTRSGFALFVAVAVVAVFSTGGCSGGQGTSTPPVVTDPSQLTAPPAGQGVQLKTDAFHVPPGTELQACYFFKVSDLMAAAGYGASTTSIDVHRVQIVQKEGSHHMNLFRVRTIVALDPANGAVQVGTNGMGQCFKSSNWADWPLIANSQQNGNQDWSFPDGVANEINADETLMLQTHYVNAHTQGTPDGIGQVGINLWTMDPGTVTAHLGTLFATDQNIRICQSDPTPTYKQTCLITSPNPVTIVGANGHFHSRGVEFDMYSWDGMSIAPPPLSSRFYQSVVWNDPPMEHSPELELPLSANGGIWYTCSYQWVDPAVATNNAITCADLNAFDMAHPVKGVTVQPTPDCCYRFGPQVDINEHCNAFVYYYPATSQTSVTCQ